MQLIRELAGKEELELEDENEFISSILSEISSVKGEMIDLRHYYSRNCPDETLRSVITYTNGTSDTTAAICVTEYSLLNFSDNPSMVVLYPRLFSNWKS